MPLDVDFLKARGHLGTAIAHLTSPNGQPPTPVVADLIARLQQAFLDLGLVIEPAA